MRYQVEYTRSKERIIIHLDSPAELVADRTICYNSSSEVSFDSPRGACVQRLFAVWGIRRVILHPHGVELEKHSRLSWGDMLSLVISILRDELAPGTCPLEAPEVWWHERESEPGVFPNLN